MLYTLIGMVSVVFVLFYLIGFNLPFEDNPAYNEPMLTDVVIVMMWAMLILALGFTLWAIARTIIATSKSSGKVFGVPVRRISTILASSTIGIMILSALISGGEPVTINGQTYDDSLWLYASGMFIITITVMLIAAVAAVIFDKQKNVLKKAK